MGRLPHLLVIALLFGGAGYGQSLADAARQNRQQKEKNTAKAKTVVETDDITATTPAPPSDKKPDTLGEKLGYSHYTPEMWKRQIEAQKKLVAFFQSEADKVKSPPDFDPKDAARDPEVRRKMEERGMQEQFAKELPGHIRQLQDLQEKARKAGMPRDVWDPVVSDTKGDPHASDH